MRVLLDESVPRQLAALLIDHTVSTIHREGWAGVTNGELLRRAAASFDALVTGDQSLQHQQNLTALTIGIVVLIAPNNRVETITGMAPAVRDALADLRPGTVAQVYA